MVSHDCVAFYLLSEDVSKHVKVVQSGQGADEVFAGYDWYPPLAGVPRDAGRRRVRARCSSTGRTADAGRHAAARSGCSTPTSAASSSRRTSAGPAPTTAVDAALRLDTQVMLVDDPVKRVDNMTMAWGLEARVPFLDHELVELAAACPPELKLADGGKGVLKDAARGVVPDEVIDRPKGYFPVPAIRHLEGPLPGAGPRRAHATRRPGAAGCSAPEYVDALLADPNTTRTTLGRQRAVAARPAGDVAADA